MWPRLRAEPSMICNNSDVSAQTVSDAIEANHATECLPMTEANPMRGKRRRRLRKATPEREPRFVTSAA